MARRPSAHLSAALVLAVVAVGVAWWAFADDTREAGTGAVETAPALAGRALPDVRVEGADGRRVSLAALVQGSDSVKALPLVINVWASTCLPCRQEMPALQAFATEYAGRLQVVGVDPLDSAGEMAEFADSVDVHYPLYRDPDGALQVEFGITALPTTLFVRADGTVATVRLGELDAAQLRALAAEYFGLR